SCFAANMSIKQNAIDCMHEFHLAAKMVTESFYVDDGLFGAGSVEEAIELRKEMQELFSREGFLLCKWNSTSKLVLESIEHHLKDVQERFYFSDISQLKSFQLHGFIDASEDVYAAVVYIRSQDTDGNIGISLVIAKSCVSPIKRMSIPRLELCGAQLLHYFKGIFNLKLSSIFAWTNTNIVLNWLQGSSRRFKVFVGNRVSSIFDRIPADRWAHVQGTDNPADAPSRGLFPSELVSHELWWNGPPWLRKPESEWPHDFIPSIKTLEEESHITLY
uniref:Uncharacterized protein n=1 Tax=Amphimedon queenslandica TaxID=400682 RepID=A0A1X7UJQ0_AMPQE